MTHAFRVGQVTTDHAGQRVHPQQAEQSTRLAHQLYSVGDHAWCFVGNGLSNQSFVRGPEGIIAIDTGESIEEMNDALRALRAETDLPVVACIYTHFHYVAGTRAIVNERGDEQFPIYGHAGIAANLNRFGGEVGPRGSRGMVYQFGMMLPEEGEDGLVNVGLGRFFRNPDHSPFTPGHMPVTQAFESNCELTIAGLPVEVMMAPSDATDSVTLWFPSLDLAVNNIFWPALFNVFAIRGEEYRDPRILLKGLDDLMGLEAMHQICTHGPPSSGREEIQRSLALYRDSIQFIWDQTVRFANQGKTLDELVELIQLPQHFEGDFRTQQLYGVVEHHVRQVYTGLFGWFDEDPRHLFPMPPGERANKMVEAMGGVDAVQHLADQAIDEADLRWALELASLLDRHAESRGLRDSERLATTLRRIAQCSPSANVRNWAITRALSLEGKLDLSRFLVHRFRKGEVLATEAARWVPVLRVLLDYQKAEGVTGSIGFFFDDGSSAGLTLRNQVAVPTAADAARLRWTLPKSAWADLLSNKSPLSQILTEQPALEGGSSSDVQALLACFDLDSFRG